MNMPYTHIESASRSTKHLFIIFSFCKSMFLFTEGRKEEEEESDGYSRAKVERKHASSRREQKKISIFARHKEERRTFLLSVGGGSKRKLKSWREREKEETKGRKGMKEVFTAIRACSIDFFLPFRLSVELNI